MGQGTHSTLTAHSTHTHKSKEAESSCSCADPIALRIGLMFETRECFPLALHACTSHTQSMHIAPLPLVARRTAKRSPGGAAAAATTLMKARRLDQLSLQREHSRDGHVLTQVWGHPSQIHMG